MNVRETPWAPGHREEHARLTADLPNVLETEFDLWQRRVDLGGGMEWGPHIRLFICELTRYATRAPGNIWAPADPPQKFTLLIAAESSQGARERAYKELETHGYNRQEWAISWQPMIHVQYAPQDSVTRLAQACRKLLDVLGAAFRQGADPQPVAEALNEGRFALESAKTMLRISTDKEKCS